MALLFLSGEILTARVPVIAVGVEAPMLKGGSVECGYRGGSYRTARAGSARGRTRIRCRQLELL
jgi:hypothetical protein